MKKLWNDRRGVFTIPAIAVALFLLTVSSVIFEVYRVQIAITQVRDALQSSVTETCQENYASIYNGIREGYSGGYRLTGDNWKESISAGDVYGRLDARLGTQEAGDYHVKPDGDSDEYKISDLTAQITDAPFAPDNGDGNNQLTCTAGIDLEVPLSTGWQWLPPFKIHLSIKSGYIPKF